MNVYDFDGTIYHGDSSIDFYFYCCIKEKAYTCLWKQMSALIHYKLGRITKKEMKEQYFSFLQKLNDIDILLEDFWDKYVCKIEPWYINQSKADDLIISASPFFLLEPVCRRLGIQRLIASDVDKHTGLFFSENCKGIEKVYRFHQLYPHDIITNFYSDSRSDAPMAQLAQNAFIVKHGKIIPWKRKTVS